MTTFKLGDQQRSGVQRHRMCTRHGATLLDVAIGSMLLAVLIVPSIHIVGKSQSASRRIQNREIILYESEQLMEKTKVSLSGPSAFADALVSPIDVIQKITVSDGPDLLGRVRADADTTIPGAQLMNVVVDVWIDIDKDSRWDVEEQGESLRTQWAAP